MNDARTLLVALEDELVLVRGGRRGWRVETRLDGRAPRSLAAAGRLIFCGCRGHGVRLSRDGGATWSAAGDDALDGALVMAVAAGEDRSAGGEPRVVAYCGLEPSRVLRSDDGGASWQALEGLDALPSASTWSFPPRPDTHHVRWIALDPLLPDRLYVCVEAGALVRSMDGGATWLDRTAGSPRDTHTLLVHPRDHGRLYSAAGDGYFESRDHGETWEQPREGLACSYMWSICAHREEPELRVVSAAAGPRQAHDAARAESFVYRRTRMSEWELCADGLPEPRGTTAPVLAADPAVADRMWLACNRGLFVSEDFGLTWATLGAQLPPRLADERVKALLVLEGGEAD